MQVLARKQWLSLRQDHHNIVDEWVAPRLHRRSTQAKHPVDDFLFDYYPFSPNKLRSWHPGMGTAIVASAEDYEDFSAVNYEFDNGQISLRPEWLTEQLPKVSTMTQFLKSVAARPARSGCFGLHEWAMVLDQNSTRHNQFPLRITQEAIRATIDEQGLRCTHFDAFRFFTDAARPLNPLQLAYDDKFTVEQPGCLHANMDLYKYASRIAPIVGSEFLRSCFILARDIRTVDMQVAPYDLSSLGVFPIRVETADGRREFSAKQQEFTHRASDLRSQLIEICEALLPIG